MAVDVEREPVARVHDGQVRPRAALLERVRVKDDVLRVVVVVSAANRDAATDLDDVGGVARLDAKIARQLAVERRQRAKVELEQRPLALSMRVASSTTQTATHDDAPCRARKTARTPRRESARCARGTTACSPCASSGSVRSRRWAPAVSGRPRQSDDGRTSTTAPCARRQSERSTAACDATRARTAPTAARARSPRSARRCSSRPTRRSTRRPASSPRPSAALSASLRSTSPRSASSHWRRRRWPRWRSVGAPCARAGALRRVQCCGRRRRERAQDAKRQTPRACNGRAARRTARKGRAAVRRASARRRPAPCAGRAPPRRVADTLGRRRAAAAAAAASRVARRPTLPATAARSIGVRARSGINDAKQRRQAATSKSIKTAAALRSVTKRKYCE